MLGGFLILSFPQNSEPQTVYQDGTNGAIYHEKPHEVEPYRKQFQDLEQLALDQKRSHDLLAAAEREFRNVV